MVMNDQGELWLVRHATADHGGALCGRRDVDAVIPAAKHLEAVRAVLAACDQIVASPARRCVQTAQAIWPDRQITTDSTLWEQDFGLHDGLPFADIPDLGPMPLDRLAQHCPPEGESFAAMAERVIPTLRTLLERACDVGPIAVIAHAGTVRAGLGMALGHPWLGLSFEVAPLSLTRICGGTDGIAIRQTNLQPG